MAGLALRTPLFVPGDRPDRFAKAAASGTDAVILDLEDAVTPEDKDKARAEVARHGIERVPVIVRINPLDGPLAAADIAALAGVPLAGVLVAKAADPQAIMDLGARLAAGTALFALIESAAGLAAARQIAMLPGMTQIAFGSIDYALDIGCEETHDALLAARSEVVLASRLAGLAAPIDGVTVGYEDATSLTAEARRARALGFGGKLLIHPRQIGPVRLGFRPSDAELAWARDIVAAAAAHGSRTFSIRGRMVDTPVIAKARRLLANAD
jgi:citrate lyase subunit beta/citryl-CoA lyase